MQPDDIAVSVDSVSKTFILPHERKTSLKSVFTSLGRSHGRPSVQVALKDIDFQIKRGEFFGIVGRNGSGKSTLLKIIAGIYQPTDGRVTVRGRLVPFIELGVGFNPELTGRQNVYLNGSILGFTPKQIDANYNKIVEFAELEQFMDQKLKNYSSGMQVRLAFACATMAKAEILLVDEVLAVGDADFQRKCFNYFRLLKREKKTVIFVTHDMNAVREYCDKALLIDNSRVQDIGKPEAIAQEYSKLFLEKDGADANADPEANRWGNGSIKLTKINVEQRDDKIIIDATAVAQSDIDKVVYGIHFFSADGRELTAMNNRMLHLPDIENVRAHETVTLSWEVLNIFNDGVFTVTTTLVDSNGSVFDWFNAAATFTVKRPDRSTTPIIPPITATITKEKRL
jgi:ABC-2 type transport system ATP-binding protein